MRFPSTPITVGMITPHQTTRTRLVSTDKTIIKSRPSNDSNSLLSTCPFHTHPILHPSQTSSPPHLFNPSYFLTSLGTTQTPYPPHPHFLFLSLSLCLCQLQQLHSTTSLFQWRLRSRRCSVPGIPICIVVIVLHLVSRTTAFWVIFRSTCGPN